MAKSSLSLNKALRGGLKHNDRTEGIEPDYLLDEKFREENEINLSAILAQKKIDFLYEEAQKNYLNTFKQELQSTSFLQEAVVNLNKKHGLVEVQKLVDRLEKETRFRCVQVSIHRDEGRVEKDKNEEEIAVYNYHAHLTFFTLDRETGQQLYRKDIPNSLRNKYRKEIEVQFSLLPAKNMIKPLGTVLKKKQKLWHVNDPITNKEIRKRFKNDGYIVYDRERMSYLQTITAEELQMERGSVSVQKEAKRLGVEVNDNPTVRQEHKQYRQSIREIEKFKKKNNILEDKLETVNKKLKETVEASNSLKLKLPNENEIIISKVLSEEVQKLKEKFEEKSDVGLYDTIVEKNNSDQIKINELENQLNEKSELLKKYKKWEEEAEIRERIFNALDSDSRSSSANDFEEFIDKKNKAGIEIKEEFKKIYYSKYVFNFSSADLERWKNNILIHREDMKEAFKGLENESKEMVEKAFFKEIETAECMDDLIERVNSIIDGKISYRDRKINYNVGILSSTWPVSEQKEKSILEKLDKNRRSSIDNLDEKTGMKSILDDDKAPPLDQENGFTRNQ